MGLAGALLGSICTWIFYRTKQRHLETLLKQSQQEGNLARETLKQTEENLHQQELLNATLEERLKLVDRYEKELSDSKLKIDVLQLEITQFREKEASLLSKIAERERAAEEKLQILENAREELTKQFSHISQIALEKNNQIFLDLAKEKLEVQNQQAKSELSQHQQRMDHNIKHLYEILEKLEQHNRSLEEKRTHAYSSLSEQIKNLVETQHRLQLETRNLVTALRAPSQRGRWGEIQLKRVVEMSGMLEYCDFEQQVSRDTEEGRLRPDLIVKLPNSKSIVVDSKVALEAYLDAVHSQDEETKKLKLSAHAQHVRRHITQLSSKSYWQQFDHTPEFVVMFLPGEPMFSAALEADPQLIEFGAEHRVLIATPITLIALLRAVAYGWRQEKIAESAQEISKMAQDLYARVNTTAEHFIKLGSNLDRSVKTYNEAIGSLERMVLPQIRKLREKGIGTQTEIPILEPIERVTREPQALELKAR